MTDADLHFYFDPVCPFAWMTSRWVHQVMAQRDYRVDWRFISLRLINADVDYDTQFPPEYEAGHTAGLRLLRMAARTRAEHGREAIGPLYTALGGMVFDVAPPADEAELVEHRARVGTAAHVRPLLEGLGLPLDLADALDDEALDAEVAAETEEALALTGRDVGTPIIQFEPPRGLAFFGPVISQLPSDEDAVRLWDNVISLAGFPGFAELKRSLRELPQLRALGVEPDQAGVTEEWHQGSRRLPR